MNNNDIVSSAEAPDTRTNDSVLIFISYDGGKTLHLMRPEASIYPPMVSTDITIDGKTIARQIVPSRLKTKGAAKGQLGSIVRLDGTAPNNSSWTQLAGIAKRYPTLHIVAVISPTKEAKGAGNSTDLNYTNGIRFLKANNITVLGAVDLEGGSKRSESEIKTDIEQWKKVYDDIDGIFLDNARDMTEEGREGYYRNIDNFIKEKMGMTFTVANVGGRVEENYIMDTSINVFIIYDGAGYPTLGSIQPRRYDWIQNYRQHKFGIISHSVPQFAIDARNFVNLAAGSPSERVAGYFYLHPESKSRMSDSLSPLFEVTLIELAKIAQQGDANLRVPTLQETPTILEPKQPLIAKEHAGLDKFGVLQIYPTRLGEDSPAEWFQKESIRQAADSKSQLLEMPQGYRTSTGWLNTEITYYIRIANMKKPQVIDEESAIIQCTRASESKGMKAVLMIDGTAYVGKYTPTGACPPRGTASASEKDLLGRWLGLKTITYNHAETGNSPQTVMVELWVDENVDDGHGNLMIKNDWKKVVVVKDEGGWIPENKKRGKSKSKQAKGKKKTKKTEPEDAPIITPGKIQLLTPPNAEVFIDRCSVREIIPPGQD